MDLVSAAVWGSAHSNNKPPLRLCPCHVPFLPTGEAPLPLGPPAWCKDSASLPFLPCSSANHRLPPTSFMAPTTELSQRPGSSQSMTGVDFRVHFGGPSLQAWTAIKPSVSSCYHLFKSSAEYGFTHVSWFTKHRQLLSDCCILIHQEYSWSKHQTVSGSKHLNALFPKLLIMVSFKQEKNKK